jgi:hypothetical protein
MQPGCTLTLHSKGEKVTAKAHGRLIDIEGVTVASVDDKVRLQAIQTWMDPLEMFRQIAPQGIVNRQAMNRELDKELALDEDASANSNSNPDDPTTQQPKAPETATAQTPAQTIITTAATQGPTPQTSHPPSNAPTTTTFLPPTTTPPRTASTPTDPTRSISSSSVTGAEEPTPRTTTTTTTTTDESRAAGVYDALDAHLERAAELVHPQPKDVEQDVRPAAGEAVVAEAGSEETRRTHEEMGRLGVGECPFLMNRE